MSTRGHVFASGATPIANLTGAHVAAHVAIQANSVTVADALSVSGNLTIGPNTHVQFVAPDPGPMVQRRYGGGNDRYGVGHDAFTTRMFASTAGLVSQSVNFSIAAPQGKYDNIMWTTLGDCNLESGVDLSMHTLKKFAWGASATKNNMIQLYGSPTSTPDSADVFGLGINPKTLRYNAGAGGVHRFMANGQSLMQFADGTQWAWRDFTCQNANLFVYNGSAHISGPLECSIAGWYANKLCVGVAAGGDVANPQETRVYGLGCENNVLVMRVGTDNGVIHFLGNTNDMGAFSHGVISGNGVNQTTGRLRIGGSGFPQWQLHLAVDSAYKPASGSWTTFSDAGLKTDIELANLDTCWTTVKTLPLKRFRWSDAMSPYVYDQRVLGWIAQDVQKHLPKSVCVSAAETHVSGDDGETPFVTTQSDFLALNEDQIHKAMYGALQKAIARIEALRARLTHARELVAARKK